MSRGASFTTLERYTEKESSGRGKWVLGVVIAVAVLIGGWWLTDRFWTPTHPTAVPATQPVTR
ncbi:MAG: hypothetical protein RL681_555 [Candidatus Parcubacteria bacterium]|jgi:hypothetical protein